MEYKPEPSKMHKIFELIKNSRIEPYFFLFMFGMSLKEVTMQSVMMEKACLLNLQQSPDICGNLDDHESVKNEVQKIALNYRIGTMLIAFFPATLSSTLLTPWSDRYGRKFPMMASVIGVTLEALGSTIVASISSAPLYLFLITHIPYGIFGGMIMAISSTYTYLSDITTEESRSTRYAFLELFYILSNPLGVEMGGVIYKYSGGVPVFITAVVANAASFVWALFAIKETRGQNEPKNAKEMMKHLFTLKNVKESFRACTAKRPGNIRAQIWFMVLAMSIYSLSMIGSLTVGFLFANKMYNWSNPKYSTIAAVVRLLHGIGLVIVVPIFTKVLRMPDTMIAIIGVLAYLAECGVKIVAYKEWMYYYAYFLGAPTGVSNVGVRSWLSKIIPKDELSKVFSLLALCEASTPMMGYAMFGPLYEATIETFPGASYLLSTVLLIISTGILVWIHKQGPLPSSSGVEEGDYIMETFNET